ncbi:4Fe-4S binding protein, partial [Paenibacillus graminis]
MTSFITLKEEIIDLSLCASCGLCAAVCPQGLLAMNGDSVSLPVFQGLEGQAADTCGSCNLCSEVCPGYDTGVMESERRIFGRNRSELERWTGIYLSTHQL